MQEVPQFRESSTETLEIINPTTTQIVILFTIQRYKGFRETSQVLISNKDKIKENRDKLGTKGEEIYIQKDRM